MLTPGRTAFLQAIATMLATPLMPAQSTPGNQIRFDAIRPLIAEVAAVNHGDNGLETNESLY